MDGVGALKKVKPDKKIKIDTVYASSIEVPLKIEPMKDPTCLRTEYFVPSFAVDGANGSRWMAAAEDSINPWIVADLYALLPDMLMLLKHRWMEKSGKSSLSIKIGRCVHHIPMS